MSFSVTFGNPDKNKSWTAALSSRDTGVTNHAKDSASPVSGRGTNKVIHVDCTKVRQVLWLARVVVS
jgi:hypothetical protein